MSKEERTDKEKKTPHSKEEKETSIEVKREKGTGTDRHDRYGAGTGDD